MKNKPNSIFDGFCHRPFNEETDGWILEQPDSLEYPALQIGQEIIAMYKEIKSLRRENWHLRKENELYKKSRGW